MPENWLAAAEDVRREINDIGFTVLLEQTSLKSGPSYAPTVTPSPFVPMKAIQRNVVEKNENGTLTGQSYTTLMLSIEATVPKRGDAFIFPDGSKRVIDTVTTIGPGGVPIYRRVRLVN